jgi:hypothetical protein
MPYGYGNGYRNGNIDMVFMYKNIYACTFYTFTYKDDYVSHTNGPLQLIQKYEYAPV